MKKLVLIILCLLSSAVMMMAESRRTIVVSDQSQFDRLDAEIKKNLRQGVVNLTVSLQSGVYYFAEKHIDLSSLQYPQSSITIVGEDALLVGRNGKSERDWQAGFYDVRNRQDVDLWSPLEQSPAPVEVVDADRKLCRIRTAKRQKPQGPARCKGQYLQVTAWYKSMVYPVVRRDRRYIYFIANDLEYSKAYRHWNVNYDCFYGKVNPRYRTIDTDVVPTGVVECLASTFLSLSHSSLANVTLRGVTFGANHGGAPLIDTDNLKTGRMSIEDCAFRGIRGAVIKVWYTDNVSVSRNVFDGCYRNGIESYNGSARTRVQGNTFVNHGKGLSQYFGVICRGESFVVSGNQFRNFCYAAIGLGLYHGHRVTGPITGIASDNDIAFEPDYYRDYGKHTLMDGGAIYVWTQCDDVCVKGNRIDNFRGVRDYRGIFCDDGTKNVTVQGNTVTNIGEGCWCIDLRWVDDVRDNVPDHNTGNTVTGNKVDGPIRFETHRP